MAEETPGGVSEADLYNPDLNEGDLDVERYTLPDAGEIADPYLSSVWAAVQAQFADGTFQESFSPKRENRD